MAKKGAQVQLQTEVNNDEEWEKLLQRHGLIVVDVYSEWCGPCAGMSANLKKLKLEIGGDALQLAMAKSDYIADLERFRNKSEPTWMFISNGMMVNLMFGADSPKLTRLIIEELKKDQMAQAGQFERETLEITDLAPEERVRYEAAEEKARIITEKEFERKSAELKDRRTQEAQAILENFPNVGTILIFPCGRDKYAEALNDIINEAGLTIATTEKVKITQDMIDEMLYFAETSFPTRSVEDLLYNKLSLALLMKRSSEGLAGDIDEVVLQLVYGNSRRPPGSEQSPSYKLMVRPELPDANSGDGDSETPSSDEDQTLLGIWAPPNSLTKAVMLKLLFPNLTAPFRFPDFVPAPLYVAVAYDTFKTKDVMELAAQYPGQVMNYGFFTSDDTAEAKLIAKTVDQFDGKSPSITYEEKIVVQLAKTIPECFEAFVELGPSFMSSDVIAGEKDCLVFFPPGYNAPEEEITRVKKKSKKKKSKPTAANNPEEEVASVATSEPVETLDEDHPEEENEDQESEEHEPEGATSLDNENEKEDVLSAADKATSPMQDEN